MASVNLEHLSIELVDYIQGVISMKSVKGSQTEKNLLISFAGESQARNRYTYFSSVAKKEGFVQISLIFEETANQEKEHAKRFFSFLEGGMVEITSEFPAGAITGTLNNLKLAAAGEYEEWTHLYPTFAHVAHEEGYEAIANLWQNVVVAEKQHHKRYMDLIKNLEDGMVFKKDKPVIWRCINCGFLNSGLEAPVICPACVHPQAYYEILAENW